MLRVGLAKIPYIWCFYTEKGVHLASFSHLDSSLTLIALGPTVFFFGCLPLSEENIDTKSIHVPQGIDCCQVSALCVLLTCLQTENYRQNCQDNSLLFKSVEACLTCGQNTS